jgi:HAE1 family hydrophobic/amphiphilic exporter-1
MAALARRFPADMRVSLVLETTVPATEGAKEIVKTLLEAIAFVVVVVSIFPQSWRATLMPILTIPVSLVGAFLFFPAVGFSTNTLSLLGLVLAVGLVVDDGDRGGGDSEGHSAATRRHYANLRRLAVGRCL